MSIMDIHINEGFLPMVEGSLLLSHSDRLVPPADGGTEGPRVLCILAGTATDAAFCIRCAAQVAWDVRPEAPSPKWPPGGIRDPCVRAYPQGVRSWGSRFG